MFHEDGFFGRPIYKSLRFWILVVLVAIATWQVKVYFDWKSENQDLEWSIQNQLSYQYWQYLERRSASLEEAYRNDPYGGETPEETLRLFVEALEAEDFELAAKYFIPEEQENALRENRSAQTGGNEKFINAYRNGRVVPPSGVGASGIYEIEIYESTEDEYPYRIRLIENEFTEKWKIIEL